jgi:hypothetical protein
MILTSLKSGLVRAFSTKRLMLVLYLASVLPALAVALPLRDALMSFAGDSLAGSELVHGVHADFLAELVTANRAAAPALAVMLALGSTAFWFVSLFLSGGALAILARDEPYRADEFWRGAAMFFGRFLRLTLWSTLLVAVLSLLPLSLREIERLAFGPDPYQYVSYWGTWIDVGAIAVALFFFRICFDYARIHAVLTGEKRTRRSLWYGVRFATGHPIRAGGLAVAVFLLGGVALLLYLAISPAFDGATTALVVAAIVLQQLYVLWRVAMRVTRYGSEISLFKNLTPKRAEPAEESVSEAV